MGIALHRPPDGTPDGVALGAGPLVIPQNRRTQRFVGGIEQRGAVHVAGKADALHLAALDSGLRQHAADGFHAGVPPVLRALLGPQRALHPDIFVHRRESPGDAAPRVYHQRARAAPVVAGAGPAAAP